MRKTFHSTNFGILKDSTSKLRIFHINVELFLDIELETEALVAIVL